MSSNSKPFFDLSLSEVVSILAVLAAGYCIAGLVGLGISFVLVAIFTPS